MTSITTSPIPTGWKLVPIEPTPEMIEAWASTRADVPDGSSDEEANALVCASDWNAMLAVTPTPSPISQAAGELFPCPFCGASAGKPENIRPGKTPLWQISCAVFCSQIRRGTKGEVIRDWNRRSTAPTTGSAPVAMDAMTFGCYLIDHCEDEYVSEESVQTWLSSAAKDPQYAKPASPAASVLTDAELTALIRKVEDKLGIVWFVPDDSETYAWRTINTNERLKYARALLAASIGRDRT
jgi:hypothetical protein